MYFELEVQGCGSLSRFGATMGAVFSSEALAAEEPQPVCYDGGGVVEPCWADIRGMGRQALEAYLRPTVEILRDETDLAKWANNDTCGAQGRCGRLPVYVGSRGDFQVHLPLVGKEFRNILQSQNWGALGANPSMVDIAVLAEVRKLRGKRLGYLASEADSAVESRAAALIEVFNKRILSPSLLVDGDTFDAKLRRMLMLVAMERCHHPSFHSPQLMPLTSRSDLEALSRDELTEHLLPQVANILGTEPAHLKVVPEELKKKCSNLGGQYASKAAWIANVTDPPSEHDNGDAENRLHVYVGRHAGPKVPDNGYGNPFVIGQDPDKYQAFYTDTSTKGGGSWPRASDCLSLYQKHRPLIQGMHDVFKASCELDDKGTWTRDNVVELFWEVMEVEQAESMAHYVDRLIGKRIACYCQPEACHGHVLRNVFCKSVLQDMGEAALKERLQRVLHERRAHKLQQQEASQSLAESPARRGSRKLANHVAVR